MLDTVPSPGNTQDILLHKLLRSKSGLTIAGLAEELGISRNAVHQHLVSLESDGVVARGETRPSGGRPEQLYVLAEEGRERFPRQYAWLAELLLESLRDPADGNLEEKLAAMGRKIGAELRGRLPGQAGSPEQIAALAQSMTGLGYDAAPRTEGGKSFIEAYNCVFHKLAEKNPGVCKFDLALMSESTGCRVEHRACMVRGGNSCRFHFRAEKDG